jgi:Ca2+-dependent lipid-binding protein
LVTADEWYGDWYHNTGVIVFVALVCWIIGQLRGSLGYVCIVLAIASVYYRTSIRRVRRNFRDDITREVAKTRLETDHESIEWMNHILIRFWPIVAPVICTAIIQSADQVLSTTTPPFLESMRIKMFTLGTKPPRMEFVKTNPKTEDDTISMDWKFSFTPNDTADLTARQIKNKVNPKIVLEVRLGVGLASKGMDIIVEDMACSGIMRVKLNLQLPYPHIEKAEICFVDRPTFDYKCKPIGGDMLGFDINFVPGLESFIQEQIHANLGPMMYLPNTFPIEIAKLLSGDAVDQAIGVLQVTFHGAQGLKNPDKFSGTPDPYATLSINNREVLGKTKTVKENANPRWNETVNIIITSLREPLTIGVFDWNEYRKDKELGVATFNLEQLQQEPEHENLQLEVIAAGRPRGVVQCDVRLFPVLEGRKLADGTVEPPPESSTGIAKFGAVQAKGMSCPCHRMRHSLANLWAELDGTKSMIGQLNPYAVLVLNGKEVAGKTHPHRPSFPGCTRATFSTTKSRSVLGIFCEHPGRASLLESTKATSSTIKRCGVLGMGFEHPTAPRFGNGRARPLAQPNAAASWRYASAIPTAPYSQNRRRVAFSTTNHCSVLGMFRKYPHRISFREKPGATFSTTERCFGLRMCSQHPHCALFQEYSRATFSTINRFVFLEMYF